MKNRYIILTTILFALGSFALPQRTQAVSPPPDGGYPGGNTAEGTSALLSRTTGMYNTAVGIYSLLSLTDASFNTALGGGALLSNTAGFENTATGAGALLSNTGAEGNPADGAFALFNNTGTASSNTAIGDRALFSNTSGSVNTATGRQVLYYNTTGNFNTASGYDALVFNNGDNNTACGVNALGSNTSGSNNTALGREAGGSLDTGDNNIDIGYNVVGVSGESNTIRIGNTDITDTFIRGISGATSSGGAAVFVNGNGKLGTLTSSARFKEEIKPINEASEAILALRPVAFRYKKEIDPQGIPQFGLVAEEVEKVNPDLVIRDVKGRPYTVRYEQINAMLLNEFLKEHRTVQDLRNEIAALTSTVKEQASQIQKVSAQVEASKSAPQVVLNNQ